MPPTHQSLGTDVCVPISRLAECVETTRRDLEDHGIKGPMIGHIGDGNFHVGIAFDTEDGTGLAKAKAAYGRLIERALAMGGTCTGEHGIGVGKRHFLAMEHGPALAVMQSIKRALDPHNIMNPGKNAAI